VDQLSFCSAVSAVLLDESMDSMRRDVTDSAISDLFADERSCAGEIIPQVASEERSHAAVETPRVSTGHEDGSGAGTCPSHPIGQGEDQSVRRTALRHQRRFQIRLCRLPARRMDKAMRDVRMLKLSGTLKEIRAKNKFYETQYETLLQEHTRLDCLCAFQSTDICTMERSLQSARARYKKRIMTILRMKSSGSRRRRNARRRIQDLKEELESTRYLAVIVGYESGMFDDELTNVWDELMEIEKDNRVLDAVGRRAYAIDRRIRLLDADDSDALRASGQVFTTFKEIDEFLAQSHS
jgi:hypothetical protein